MALLRDKYYQTGTNANVKTSISTDYYNLTPERSVRNNPEISPNDNDIIRLLGAEGDLTGQNFIDLAADLIFNDQQISNETNLIIKFFTEGVLITSVKYTKLELKDIVGIFDRGKYIYSQESGVDKKAQIITSEENFIVVASLNDSIWAINEDIYTGNEDGVADKDNENNYINTASIEKSPNNYTTLENFQIVDQDTNSLTVGGGLIKTHDMVKKSSNRVTYTLGIDIPYNSVSAEETYRSDLIEYDLENESFNLITGNTRGVLFPELLSKTLADRSNKNTIPLYSIIIKQEAGENEIADITSVYPEAGLGLLKYFDYKKLYYFKDPDTQEEKRNIFQTLVNDTVHYRRHDNTLLEYLDGQQNENTEINELEKLSDSTINGIYTNGLRTKIANDGEIEEPGNWYSQIKSSANIAPPGPDYVFPNDASTYKIYTNGWFNFNSIAKSFINTEKVELNRVKIGVRRDYIGEEGFAISLVTYPYYVVNTVNRTLTVKTYTPTEIVIGEDGSGGTLDVDLSSKFNLSNGLRSKNISSNSFILFTEGNAKGLTFKIVQVDTENTHKLIIENNTTGIDIMPDDKFIIFQNNFISATDEKSLLNSDLVEQLNYANIYQKDAEIESNDITDLTQLDFATTDLTFDLNETVNALNDPINLTTNYNDGSYTINQAIDGIIEEINTQITIPYLVAINNNGKIVFRLSTFDADKTLEINSSGDLSRIGCSNSNVITDIEYISLTFDYTLDSLSSYLYKNNYYFILTRAFNDPKEETFGTLIKQHIQSPNFSSSLGQNIAFAIEYESASGRYPLYKDDTETDEPVLVGYDIYGPLHVPDDNRLNEVGVKYYTAKAKSLTDYEILKLENDEWTGLEDKKTFYLDVATGRLMFNPLTQPIGVWMAYYYENIVTGSKSPIYTIGEYFDTVYNSLLIENIFSYVPDRYVNLEEIYFRNGYMYYKDESPYLFPGTFTVSIGNNPNLLDKYHLITYKNNAWQKTDLRDRELAQAMVVKIQPDDEENPSEYFMTATTQQGAYLTANEKSEWDNIIDSEDSSDGLTPGTIYYLSEDNPGQITKNVPYGNIKLRALLAIDELNATLLLNQEASEALQHTKTISQTDIGTNKLYSSLSYSNGQWKLSDLRDGEIAETIIVEKIDDNTVNILSQSGALLSANKTTWNALTGTTGGLTIGAKYYLDAKRPGKITTTPVYGEIKQSIFYAVSNTEGILSLKEETNEFFENSYDVVVDSAITSPFTPIYYNFSNSQWEKADLNSGKIAEGIVIEKIDTTNANVLSQQGVVLKGDFTNITVDGLALTKGATYYLAPENPGKITSNIPIGQRRQAIFHAIGSDSATTVLTEESDEFLQSVFPIEQTDAGTWGTYAPIHFNGSTWEPTDSDNGKFAHAIIIETIDNNKIRATNINGVILSNNDWSSLLFNNATNLIPGDTYYLTGSKLTNDPPTGGATQPIYYAKTSTDVITILDPTFEKRGTSRFSIEQTNHGLSVLSPIYFNNATQNWEMAFADDFETKLAEAIILEVLDADNFVATSQSGMLVNIQETDKWDAIAGTTGGLTPNTKYFLSNTYPGKVDTTEDETYIQPIYTAISSTAAILNLNSSVNLANYYTFRVNQPSHNFTLLNVVTKNLSDWRKSDLSAGDVGDGIVVKIDDTDNFRVFTERGKIITAFETEWNTIISDNTGLVAGESYYLDPNNPGMLTATRNISAPVQTILTAIDSTTAILVLSDAIDFFDGIEVEQAQNFLPGQVIRLNPQNGEWEKTSNEEAQAIVISATTSSFRAIQDAGSFVTLTTDQWNLATNTSGLTKGKIYYTDPNNIGNLIDYKPDKYQYQEILLALNETEALINFRHMRTPEYNKRISYLLG